MLKSIRKDFGVDRDRMKEYVIHVWGGAWNNNANPSIEKELGIKDGYYYFTTEKEKDDFLNLIRVEKYRGQGLVYDIRYGEMNHKRTIFVGTFEYKEKYFTIHHDFGYEFHEETAIFQFVENNYSCDCNRSLIIQREYGEDAIPELCCGEEIKLVEYHFEYIN